MTRNEFIAQIVIQNSNEFIAKASISSNDLIEMSCVFANSMEDKGCAPWKTPPIEGFINPVPQPK